MPTPPPAAWIPVAPQPGPGAASGWTPVPPGAGGWQSVPSAPPYVAAPPANPALAVGPALGWMPVPDLPRIEPDAFWLERAVPRLPRWNEATFWGGLPRPNLPDFEALTTRSTVRFAGFAFIAGLLGVLAMQFLLPQTLAAWLVTSFTPFGLDYAFLRVLALFAPLFEELFKFGLALFLVSWMPSNNPAVLGVRIVAGWLVGASFGWMEHTTVYNTEDDLGHALRVTFHGVAVGLSMATYTVLERSPRIGLRWYATCVSTTCHWLVNAFALPVGVVALAVGSDLLPFAWMALASLLAVVATVAVPVAGERLRSRLERAVP